MKSNQHVSFPTFQSNCKVFKFYSFNTCHHFIGILAHQNHGIFHKIMFYNVLSPMNYVTIFLYTIFSKYHLHQYGDCITARTLCILCVVSWHVHNVFINSVIYLYFSYLCQIKYFHTIPYHTIPYQMMSTLLKLGLSGYDVTLPFGAFQCEILVALDTHAKKMNPPSIILGGVHGRVCWPIISYYIKMPVKHLINLITADL